MKNILIIGSNSFLAGITSAHLQKSGYHCIHTSRNGESEKLKLDLENEQSIESFGRENKDRFDGVLFFQGINPSRNTKETDSQHFGRMLHLNLTGPALFMKHLHTCLNDNAMLLFFSSVAASKGSYDPSYAAAKSGLSGLIYSFANEFSRLRFNILSLGLVENSPVYKQMSPDFREKHLQRMNNRFIQPDDVSSMIIELLANDSVNRATIPLDGGFKS